MPRPKKPPGTAVDSRNGARLSLVAPAAGVTGVPTAPKGLPAPERRWWREFWASPQAALILSTEHVIVQRWAEALARYRQATELADADPISKGSMGQEVESPYYGIAEKALKTAERCEAQLGLGPLHRMKLGVQVGEASRSLADLNAALTAGGDLGDDGGDPRVIDPRLASS